MTKIIGIGTVSIYLVYPFICPIFSFLEDLIHKQSPSLNNKHQLIRSFIFFFSQIFCIFLDIIENYRLKKRNKGTKKQEEVLIINNEKIENEEKAESVKGEEIVLQKKHSNLLLIILGTTILEYMLYSLLNILSTNSDVLSTIQLEMKALPVFCIALLNKYFLKYPFYRHHLFAVIIIFIGFITILTFHIIFDPINGDYEATIILVVIFSLLKFLRAIKEMLDTYILQERYVSPFLLLFYQGVIGVIISIIFIAIFQNVKCINYENLDYCVNGYYENISTFFNLTRDVGSIFLVIAFILCTICIEVCRMQTKKYLSTIHRGLSCSASAIFSWFFFLNVLSFGPISFLQRMYEILGFVFILLGELIYCEVFIFYFWGLDENTKKEIQNREAAEIEQNIDLVKTGKKYNIK